MAMLPVDSSTCSTTYWVCLPMRGSVEWVPLSSSTGVRITSTPASLFLVVSAKSEVSRVRPPLPSLLVILRTLLMPPLRLRAAPPRVTDMDSPFWAMKAVPSS